VGDFLVFIANNGVVEISMKNGLCYVAAVILCIASLAGCNFLAGSRDSAEGLVLPGQNDAKLSFKVVLPGVNENDPMPGIRGSSNARVTFILHLISPGAESGSQVSRIVRTVDVTPEGRAEATFGALPTTTVVGNMVIKGGSIGGKSDFHGATDLSSGDNTLQVTPVGSGDINDLAATVIMDLITMPEIIRAAPTGLAANVKTGCQKSLNSGCTGSSLYSDAVARFIEASPLTADGQARLSTGLNGELTAVFPNGESITKTPDQLWVNCTRLRVCLPGV
jgi:hypothetical protein